MKGGQAAELSKMTDVRKRNELREFDVIDLEHFERKFAFRRYPKRGVFPVTGGCELSSTASVPAIFC